MASHCRCGQHGPSDGSQAPSGLDGLPRAQAKRIIRAIAELAADPHAARNVKARHSGGFRLGVDDWQVSYALVATEFRAIMMRSGPGERCIGVHT